MNPKNSIWQSVELEYRRSKKKHPRFPVHVCAQAGIVSRKAGKLMDLSIEKKYSKNKSPAFKREQTERIRMEAIKTIVNTIRFIENLKA